MEDDSVPLFVSTLSSHLGRNQRLFRSNLTRGVPQSAQRSIEVSNWSVDEMKSGRGHDRTPSPTKRVRLSHLRESQRGRCYCTNGRILQCQESTSNQSTRLCGAVTAKGGQSLSGGLSVVNPAGVHSIAVVNPEFKASPGSICISSRTASELPFPTTSLTGAELDGAITQTNTEVVVPALRKGNSRYYQARFM